MFHLWLDIKILFLLIVLFMIPAFFFYAFMFIFLSFLSTKHRYLHFLEISDCNYARPGDTYYAFKKEFDILVYKSLKFLETHPRLEHLVYHF
ncbi:hypothetical protein C0583_06780 [Candidatus Parcubacteria bacterium]|nr:MAG: hypothetical protein C0583_06780 [Candidatus Parcubacteria bacterium]